jgi:hypothetical protein
VNVKRDPPVLPYAHLNLRYNPFGRLTPEEKCSFDAIRIDLDSYANRLSEPGYALQFLKEGRPGKTTNLLALRRYFPGAPYVFIEAQGVVPDIPQAPVLFIDQMQRIPRARRLEILRRPGSFAIVSHANHEREFRRAKLRYDLIKLSGLPVDRLCENVEQRIERARRYDDLPVPTVRKTAVAELLSMFGDDLVAIHGYLYDVFQNMTEVCDVETFDRDHL